MTTTNSISPSGVNGSFLREVQRLIEISGQTAPAIAVAIGLPLAVLTGAHGGIMRIPGPKLKRLAEELGVRHDALLRVWLQECQPWLVELLDDIMHDGSTGVAASAASSGTEPL